MVINDGRCAVFNGIDQERQGRIARAFFIQSLVQFPPEFFKDLLEIYRWLTRNRHPTRKSPIKVSMSTDVARHDHLTLRVQNLFLWEPFSQPTFRLDRSDDSVLNKDLMPFQDLVGFTPCHNAAVLNDHVASLWLIGSVSQLVKFDQNTVSSLGMDECHLTSWQYFSSLIDQSYAFFFQFCQFLVDIVHFHAEVVHAFTFFLKVRCQSGFAAGGLHQFNFTVTNRNERNPGMLGWDHFDMVQGQTQALFPKFE